MQDISAETIKQQLKQSTVLSIITAVIVGILLVISLITTMGSATTILMEVEMVKNDVSPVSVAAGHIETTLVQLRTVAMRSIYIHSYEGIEDMNRIYDIADTEMQGYLETLTNSQTINRDQANSLQNGYALLSTRQKTLVDMCLDPQVDIATINKYVNTDIYPLVTGMLALNTNILDESTVVIDEAYDSVNAACRNSLFVSWLLLIAVAISLFVYLAIVRRKSVREEKLYTDLQEALAQAQAANSAKSTFLSSMSHDIRTPMNAIVGLTTIAKAHMDDPQRVRDCLDHIDVSSKHLLSLVNDVLDMSEIESGKIVLNRSAFRISQLIDDLLAISQPQAAAKRLTFDVNVADLQHSAFIGDTVRLNQALINLTSNAIKYTNPGGTVRIDIAERPSERAGCSDFWFTVEDTGIGMEPDFLTYIFEPFERERNETTPFTEGAGLGMAITKNVVDLMEGSISVESEPGRGSKFTVIVPLEIASEEDAAKIAPENEKTDDSAGALHGCVLIVEDDALNREIATELIRSKGVDVEVACDGVEAVERMATVPVGTFGMIFMDCQMPRMGGIEATERIIAHERSMGIPHTPIVMLTANAFNEDRQRCMNAGADGFMTKPISLTELERHLRQYLD